MLCRVEEIVWVAGIFDSGWSRVNGGENSKQGSGLLEVKWGLCDFVSGFI